MKAWIASLAVVVLLFAGCGGGGDSSSATTTERGGEALTKAELIEQGDAICAKPLAIRASLNPEGTPEEAVRVASLVTAMVNRLLALGTPKETEYTYAEYTTAAHALVQAETEVKAMAKKGDPVDLRRAESGSLSTFSMFESLAGQYGFTDCAGI
jgi:hypothetical protein